jgi:hypothetical protein
LNLPEELEPVVLLPSYRSFYETLPAESKAVLEERQESQKSTRNTTPRPYSEEGRAILQPWFDANESALALFEEALQKPDFYLPVVHGEYDIEQVEPSLTRFVSNIFYQRCLLHLSFGNTEAAWHDVQQIYRLAKLHHPRVLMISSMWANENALRSANKAAESVLLYGNWNNDGIRQAWQEVTASQHLLTDADAQRIMLGNRLCRLDRDQSYFQTFVQSDAPPFPLPRCVIPIGRMMIATNQDCDEQCENYRKAPEDRKSTDPFDLGVFGLIWRYGLWNGSAVMMASIWSRSDGFIVLANSIDRSEAESALTQLVFALELYRKEHENRYPPDLATLCDGYIEKVPRDPFSQAGESMIYKVYDDSTGYLVYSIGENRTDDDGRTYSDNQKGDDIRRERNFLLPLPYPANF